VCLGRRHGRGAPAPGSLRIPDHLRAGNEEAAPMSRLRIFNVDDPSTPVLATGDHGTIAERLGAIGVRFEQWQANAPLEPGASHEAVMSAYRNDIDRLVLEKGFKSVDVVSIAPDHPDREAMRRKFLDEHFHKEDEV